ncbi:MAG: glycosyl transferase [Clostridia bacterium]|nr:glycosyl transferase [Clostridia bacterium]
MIRDLIPRPIKDFILYIVRIPQRLRLKLYYAASNGRFPFPDKAFQKWDYKIHTGRKLNLRHPVTFQDKLQWLKYYYRKPEFTQMVDKYGARSFVADKIGEEYLVPLYGVFDSWDEIDFSALPDQFVIKCTHDSGSYVICTDKTKLDVQKAKAKIETGLARKQFYLSREWPYKNVKPRIIIEQYLEDKQTHDLVDYKFFCFDGKVKLLESNTERRSETGTKTDFYSPEFEYLQMREAGYPNSDRIQSKPERFEEMIKLAEILSEGIPFLRVDFNYANNQIYFGELTFFHCGGRMLLEPDEYNYKLGEMIHLPEKYR